MVKKLIPLSLFFIIFLCSGCLILKPTHKNSEPFLEKPASNSITNSTNQNSEKNCIKLGENGINPSMGPSSKNIGRVCCEGLVMISPTQCYFESDTQSGCSSHEGCASMCIACGDNICDSKYENKCNCPGDCK